MIDSQVINHLLDAELVVADLSFQNANAFYEVGLRHMERKPIIHMYLEGQVIPFDIKPYRAIPFSFQHPAQRFEAREMLKEAIEAVLDKDFRVENPVTRARGYAELIKHAMPGLDVALAEIEALKTQVRAIEIMAATANARAMNASAPFAAPGPTGPTGYGVGGGVAGGYVGGGGVTGGPQSGIFGQGATLGSGDMPRGGILIDRPLVLREEEERKRKGDGS